MRRRKIRPKQSPQHEAALSEMRRLLADPDHPVADLFLVTMSVLSLNKDESPEVLRPQREQRYQAIHAEFLDDLPRKRGNALAVSLYTALNQVGPQQTIPREENEQLAAQLPAIFDRLPVEKQYELLYSISVGLAAQPGIASLAQNIRPDVSGFPHSQ